MEESWLYPPPSPSLTFPQKGQAMKTGTLFTDSLSLKENSSDSKNIFWYYSQYFSPNHIYVLGTATARNSETLMQAHMEWWSDCGRSNSMRKAGSVDSLQGNLEEKKGGIYSLFFPCFCPSLSLSEFFHGKVTENLVFPAGDIHSSSFYLWAGLLCFIDEDLGVFLHPGFCLLLLRHFHPDSM